MARTALDTTRHIVDTLSRMGGFYSHLKRPAYIYTGVIVKVCKFILRDTSDRIYHTIQQTFRFVQGKTM